MVLGRREVGRDRDRALRRRSSMADAWTGLLVFAFFSGAALLTLWLHPRLPSHHLSKETTDIVRLGVGVVATITALALGLLISSVKGSFDQAMDLVDMGSESPQETRLRLLLVRSALPRPVTQVPAREPQDHQKPAHLRSPPIRSACPSRGGSPAGRAARRRPTRERGPRQGSRDADKWSPIPVRAGKGGRFQRPVFRLSKSQARAVFQSRQAVAVEIPSISPACSNVRPAK